MSRGFREKTFVVYMCVKVGYEANVIRSHLVSGGRHGACTDLSVSSVPTQHNLSLPGHSSLDLRSSSTCRANCPSSIDGRANTQRPQFASGVLRISSLAL